MELNHAIILYNFLLKKSVRARSYSEKPVFLSDQFTCAYTQLASGSEDGAIAFYKGGECKYKQKQKKPRFRNARHLEKV